MHAAVAAAAMLNNTILLSWFAFFAHLNEKLIRKIIKCDLLIFYADESFWLLLFLLVVFYISSVSYKMFECMTFGWDVVFILRCARK